MKRPELLGIMASVIYTTNNYHLQDSGQKEIVKSVEIAKAILYEIEKEHIAKKAKTDNAIPLFNAQREIVLKESKNDSNQSNYMRLLRICQDLHMKSKTGFFPPQKVIEQAHKEGLSNLPAIDLAINKLKEWNIVFLVGKYYTFEKKKAEPEKK